MFIIHAVFQVRPDRKAAFLEEAKPLIAATLQEDGNLSYDLYEHAGRENEFIMVETWRDAEAMAAHSASPHFTGFAAKAPEFLAAPMDLKVYSAEPLKREG